MESDDTRTTGGIAQIGGTCKWWGQNCVVVTVRSYHHSFYLAHEFGHSLGADHDSWGTPCQQGIMQPDASTPHLWSECSNQAINSHISDRDKSWCLTNTSGTPIWDLSRDTWMPSEKADILEQCHKAWGFRYSPHRGHLWDALERTMPPCLELLCSYDMLVWSAGWALEHSACRIEPATNRWGNCSLGKCS